MTTRLTKTEFFQKNGHRLVQVWEDDVETGDFQLFAPEEDELAMKYHNDGYIVCTVYEPANDGEEDVVEEEFNTANNPFKVGYLILEKDF